MRYDRKRNQVGITFTGHALLRLLGFDERKYSVDAVDVDVFKNEITLIISDYDIPGIHEQKEIYGMRIASPDVVRGTEDLQILFNKLLDDVKNKVGQ